MLLSDVEYLMQLRIVLLNQYNFILGTILIVICWSPNQAEAMGITRSGPRRDLLPW